MAKIYLDLNIYRHILENRCHHDDIAKKINYLKSQGSIFPYSPAHMEEIGVMCRESSQNIDLINKHMQIISNISSNNELLPGRSSLAKIRMLRHVYEVSHCPISSDIKAILDETEQEWLLGKLSFSDLKTRLIVEHPSACLTRVLNDLGITDFALDNDVFHMGRKNSESVQKNLASIGRTDDKDVIAFDELRKRNNIDVVELSNLCGYNVFMHPGVLNVLKNSYSENGFPFSDILSDIPRGTELLNSHEALEDHVTICMNVLDKVGYFTDRQNDVLKLRSRMHDVTHAIYGATTDIFVTDDSRYAKRLTATYSLLRIPAKVLSSTEFILSTTL